MVNASIAKPIKYFLLGLILAIMIFPLLWMFRVAFFMPGTPITMSNLFGGEFTLSNFYDLFSVNGFGRYLFNSVIVGVLVTVGNILFCFMVAYSLARTRIYLNRLMFVTVIAVLMLPAHIIIIPLYLMCVKTGIYDTYWALILPWLVSPIGIFLIKQYIESIPPSMEEAARIDGAGEMRILLTVVMPLCRPVMAVLAIQVFFTNWNSFLFPYLLTQSDSVRTLPVALALFQGHQAIDWQHLMAGAAIAVLPVLVLFLILQRQIVSGITAGAVKQ